MIFLDGVGLGSTDPQVNPLYASHLPALRSLFDGELPSLDVPTILTNKASAIPLDANLGIEGLPQSGTGQTALFTGVNGAKVVGKHFGPHPYSTLRPIIAEKNIFKQLLDARRKPCFVNAFPQRFFDYINHRRSRMTVTTLSCLRSGMRLLDVSDLENERGISADITNAGWPELGYPHVRQIPPAEAGRRLVRISELYDFVLFEYWKTDHAGHAQAMDEAISVLERLDGMLAGVLETLNEAHTLLFMTSDHGNIEDLSRKGHTRNPVPALMVGYRHAEMARLLLSISAEGGSLTHVTPLLVQLLTGEFHEGARSS